MKFFLTLLSISLLVFACFALVKQPLTEQEESWIAKSSRAEINGWIHVKVSGDPYERGFQYGYNVAKDYAEAIRVYKKMTLDTMGMTLDFFVNKSVEFHASMVDKELLDEMSGIAAGLTKAGVPTTTDQIIGWNGNMEMTGYWWPTVQKQYATAPKPPTMFAKAHCSGFVATGKATNNGKIVIGHESFTEFWNGQFFNVILDITPTNGSRMVFQTSPGWISSMTDFWVAESGLVLVETTIAGYFGYDVTKKPEWLRVRMATQYADSIESWVKTMNDQNNGGYANSWLLGDTKTNKIAEYEQGLTYQYLNIQEDGFIFGDNVANSPEIRNLECYDTGYSDVRQQTGARRTRWPQLLNGYSGRINSTIGQVMLGDTWDPYLKKENPSSRCICSHYDVDPQYYVSDPTAVWNVPFYPAGSVDGKVTTADAAASMSMWGIFGRADGVAFDVDYFLKEHPQWNWQEGYLQSRPSQPWTYFDGSK